MNNLSLDYILKINEIKAIQELKKELNKEFKLSDMIMFGSVARQEADEESDLDLLIILKEEANHMVRNYISDIVFEINLNYDTNISIVVIEKTNWDNGLMQITPLYKEIEKDGVLINEFF